MVKRVVDEIRCSQGRFLEQVKNNRGEYIDKWVDIGDTRAMTKTSQAFRDMRPPRNDIASSNPATAPVRKNPPNIQEAIQLHRKKQKLEQMRLNKAKQQQQLSDRDLNERSDSGDSSSAASDSGSSDESDSSDEEDEDASSEVSASNRGTNGKSKGTTEDRDRVNNAERENSDEETERMLQKKRILAVKQRTSLKSMTGMRPKALIVKKNNKKKVRNGRDGTETNRDSGKKENEDTVIREGRPSSNLMAAAKACRSNYDDISDTETEDSFPVIRQP